MAKYINLEDAKGKFEFYTKDMLGSWIAAMLDSLPAIEVSEDAISREMVSKRLAELWETEHPEKSYDKWLKIASEWCDYFPSVIPKRSCYRCGLREDCEDSTERKPKEGEWIYCEDDDSHLPEDGWYGIFKCSNCENEQSFPISTGSGRVYGDNYCPNCGEKMKGADDE